MWYAYAVKTYTSQYSVASTDDRAALLCNVVGYILREIKMEKCIGFFFFFFKNHVQTPERFIYFCRVLEMRTIFLIGNKNYYNITRRVSLRLRRQTRPPESGCPAEMIEPSSSSPFVGRRPHCPPGRC